MWVRGLKQTESCTTATKKQSHPMWVRGLKLANRQKQHLLLVAPYVGAWIETIVTLESLFTSLCRTLCGCVD